jgi:uncharacterized protein YbjQ (UPF0145 family)
MSAQECVSCGKPKAVLNCDVCQDPVCKKCDQILARDTFSFLPVVPEALSHMHYCNNCHDSIVAPELEAYDEVMEQAKAVYVFFTTQRKEIPLIRKEREVLKVKDCDDRDETILRLAFLSAKQGFNAIIEVEVNAEKVRDGAYQTSRWSGKCVAAMVDGQKVELQDKRKAMYRY